MYVPTDEAKKYLSEGFPEELLLSAVLSGKDSFEELKKEEFFRLGFPWARKKGWIDVREGKIVPLVDSARSEERGMLERLGDLSLDEEKHLLSRNLITKEREIEIPDKIGELTHDLILTKAWEKAKFARYDPEKPGKYPYPGKYQPYRRFLDSVRHILVKLGFREMTGPLIETEFWNFDALFQPQNHPARGWTDTYKLAHPKKGRLPPVWEKVKESHEKSWNYEWDPEVARQLMPRAHGTALSARMLASGPQIPGRYYAIARVFRPDVLDATHLIEFNQVEGIVLDEGLKFKHLLGILKMFAVEVAGAEKVRFLPDYYPFTEPSVQMSAKHPELGWVEFGGAGIFREELAKPLGVDVPVIAWGIGIDRLAMFKLGITDIRYLFSDDLDWLRNAPLKGL